MRLLAVVIACLVAFSGESSGGSRRKSATPAASRRKPSSKTKPTKPAKPTEPTKPAEEPADPPEPPPAASRDVRKTLEAVTIRKQPGERQPALATLPAGTEVIVEAEQGRWLRVRAGKVSGYLTRTTVSDPAVPPRPDAPPGGGTAGVVAAGGGITEWSGTRRPDPKQAPVTEIFVEVIAESAELRAEARLDAKSVARVSRGARLAIVESDEASGWVRARDDAGRAGWIARDQVGNTAAARAAAPSSGGRAPVRPRRPDAPAPRAARAIALRADAGVGYRTLGMDFQSNGGDGLANYLVDSGTGAAELELEAALRPSARWRFAADGRLQLSRLSPGITYEGPSSTPGTIAFSTFSTDLGVRAGRALGSAFEVWLRAGGHYDAFVATDVENAGRLPRERLLGATAGARFDIAPPRSRISASLWGDALVLGSRRQTPGLEDGTDSSVRAVWAGATVRFRISAYLSILGAYDFGRVTTEWSGMSVRQPGVTEARRTDGSQLVQLGLGAEM